MEVLVWIQGHWTTLLQIVLQIIGAARIIVKLTPTQKDDSILAKVVAVVDKIALNTTKHS